MRNGLVNVYKEPGFTSHDVVAKLRGIFGQKKIGHTGTLDPAAEGVLPIALGKATKVCSLLTEEKKTYEAVLLLGTETDTQDTTGTVIAEKPVNVTKNEVEACLNSFLGDQMQIPPMYSALKYKGRRLYDLAREGIVVERKPRPAFFYGIRILEMNLPEVRFEVTCSRGTYIRTLCHDIGGKLGCGGCMKHLIRTRSGCFSASDALTLGEIEAAKEKEELDSILIPVDRIFSGVPCMRSLPEGDVLLHNGNALPADLLAGAPDGTDLLQADVSEVRMYDSGGVFTGLFRPDEEAGLYRPVTMFYDAEQR